MSTVDYRESPFGRLTAVQWGAFAGGVQFVTLASGPFPFAPALSPSNPNPLLNEPGNTLFEDYIEPQLTLPDPYVNGSMLIQSRITIDARPTGGTIGDPITTLAQFPDDTEVTLPALTVTGVTSEATYTIPTFTATRSAGSAFLPAPGGGAAVVKGAATGSTSYFYNTSETPPTETVTSPDFIQFIFDVSTGYLFSLGLFLMSTTTGGGFQVGERVRFELAET